MSDDYFAVTSRARALMMSRERMVSSSPHISSPHISTFEEIVVIHCFQFPHPCIGIVPSLIEDGLGGSGLASGIFDIKCAPSLLHLEEMKAQRWTEGAIREQ